MKTVESTGRLEASERREQLLQVAIDLFSRKGFKGTTTREIAAAAGVTEAIIFRHFETKQHLYTAIIDRKLDAARLAHWVKSIKLLMDSNDDEAVFRTLISAIIQTNREDPKFERLMLYAALEGHEFALLYIQRMSGSLVDTFRKYFLRRQKEKALAPVAPELALTAIVGMAQHFAHAKYIHGCKPQAVGDEEAVESFTRMTLHGFSTGKQGRAAGK